MTPVSHRQVGAQYCACVIHTTIFRAHRPRPRHARAKPFIMKAIKHVAAAVVAVLAVMLAALIATVTLIVADTATRGRGRTAMHLRQ